MEEQNKSTKGNLPQKKTRPCYTHTEIPEQGDKPTNNILSAEEYVKKEGLTYTAPNGGQHTQLKLEVAEIRRLPMEYTFC